MQQKNRYQDIFDNSKLKSQFVWDIIKMQKPCNNEVKIIPKIIIQYWDDSNNISSDVLLCTIYAGLFAGIGLGIVFRLGYSTGGIDVPVILLSNKTNVSVGTYNNQYVQKGFKKNYILVFFF